MGGHGLMVVMIGFMYIAVALGAVIPGIVVLRLAATTMPVFGLCAFQGLPSPLPFLPFCPLRCCKVWSIFNLLKICLLFYFALIQALNSTFFKKGGTPTPHL